MCQVSVARRRTRARKRLDQAHELDVRWAFRLDRLPLYAVAVSVCSCGRRAWLMPGASPEDHQAFTEDSENHDYAHQLEDDR